MPACSLSLQHRNGGHQVKHPTSKLRVKRRAMCSEARTSLQANNDAEASTCKSHLTENQRCVRCTSGNIASTRFCRAFRYLQPPPLKGTAFQRLRNCCRRLQRTGLSQRPGLSQAPAQGGSLQFLPPPDHTSPTNVKLLRLKKSQKDLSTLKTE